MPVVNSTVRSPDLKRAQAEMILARRVTGVPVQQIAKDMGVCRRTVQSRLDWAEKQGMLDEYRAQIFDELIPLAIEAMKVALAEGSVEAAKSILFGTGVLSKTPDKSSTTTTMEVSLADWRTQHALTRITQTHTEQHEDSDPAPSILQQVMTDYVDQHEEQLSFLPILEMSPTDADE